MMDDNGQTLSFRTRAGWLAGMVTVIVAVDQWSKWYAFTHWRGLPPRSFFGDVFRIEYAENRGAFLSLLANMPDSVRFWVLVVINGLVLAGLTLFLLTTRRITLSTFLPFSLFVAGGIGNLIDRIHMDCVIDFFNLGLGGLRTGIFNVADMAITLGFVLMLPMLFQGEPRTAPAQATAERDLPTEPASRPN